MARKNYTYSFQGTGGDGSPWSVDGTIYCELHEAFECAMIATYTALTEGKAVYGNPGKGGCAGPYGINRVVIELKASSL